MAPVERGLSRRSVLRSGGLVAVAGLAGCPGDGSAGTETPDEGTSNRPEPEQQLPAPTAGDPDAAVTVAAFEDLACPHCATYSLETLPEIWSEYVEPGDIRYEWHDFPIPVEETHSWLAADAARSVQANADSGADFWEFTDAVFENQDALSLDQYESLANDVGVDGAVIRQEAEDRTYEPTVVASKQQGEQQDVTGTPTVFVDDRRLEGPTADALRNAIDDALESGSN